MKAARRKSTRYLGFTIRHVGDRWQLEQWDSGRLRRWRYQTKAEAEDAASKRRASLDAIGRQADAMTSDQRTDAVKALAKLKGTASLVAAAECWLRYHRPPEGALSFGAMVDAYLADAKARNLRPASLVDLRNRLARLRPDIGDVPAVAIDGATLDAWLDAQSFTASNRMHYRRILHCTFAWAVEQGHTPDNPAAGLRRVKLESGMPAVFTPAQVETIMRAAEKAERRALPYLALAFFAGIRPAELVRLTWADVDLAAGTVTIRPEYAKKRRSRIIALADNARRWLVAYRPRDAQASTGIVPSYMSLRRWLADVRKAAKLGAWPADVARHCFGTYHLALHGDISRTCLDMGHTGPGVLFSHYRNLSTKDQAAAFFAIAPAAEAAVIPFSVAG